MQTRGIDLNGELIVEPAFDSIKNMIVKSPTKASKYILPIEIEKEGVFDLKDRKC